jgi:hypothetical protein
MPLTPSKAKHIAAKLRAVALGRTQLITLTLRTPAGGTTTMTIPMIWKPAEDADPSMVPPGSGTPGFTNIDQTADIVAIALQQDISLAQIRAVISAQPASPTGAEVANRYILTSDTPKGITPGGDRLLLTFRRQR